MSTIGSLALGIQQQVEIDKKKTLPEWILEGLGARKPVAPYTAETRLSASRVHDMCPRFETLRAAHGITVYDDVSPQLGWIFNVGKLYHSYYRDWLMGPRGIYYGKWRCLVCGWTTDGDGTDDEIGPKGVPLKSFMPPPPHPSQRAVRMVSMPRECGGCGAPRRGTAHTVSGREVPDDHPLIVFDEWPMVNLEYGIHLMSDGWRLVMSTREMRNQEIKSISWSGYQEVKKKGIEIAKPQHVTQSMLCTWASGMREGEVLYLNKSAWKEPADFVHACVVPLKMPWLEANAFGPIRAMREHLAAGTVAPRVCIYTNVERAQKCELRDLCFKEPNG